MIIDWVGFSSVPGSKCIVSYPASCAAMRTAARSAYGTSWSATTRAACCAAAEHLIGLSIHRLTEPSAYTCRFSEYRVHTWGRCTLHICHLFFVWIKPNIRTLDYIPRDGVVGSFASVRPPVRSWVVILMRSQVVSNILSAAGQ